MFRFILGKMPRLLCWCGLRSKSSSTATKLIYGNQDDKRVGSAIRKAEVSPFWDLSSADETPDEMEYVG